MSYYQEHKRQKLEKFKRILQSATDRLRHKINIATKMPQQKVKTRIKNTDWMP